MRTLIILPKLGFFFFLFLILVIIVFDLNLVIILILPNKVLLLDMVCFELNARVKLNLARLKLIFIVLLLISIAFFTVFILIILTHGNLTV